MSLIQEALTYKHVHSADQKVGAWPSLPSLSWSTKPTQLTSKEKKDPQQYIVDDYTTYTIDQQRYILDELVYIKQKEDSEKKARDKILARTRKPLETRKTRKIKHDGVIIGYALTELDTITFGTIVFDSSVEDGILGRTIKIIPSNYTDGNTILDLPFIRANGAKFYDTSYVKKIAKTLDTDYKRLEEINKQRIDAEKARDALINMQKEVKDVAKDKITLGFIGVLVLSSHAAPYQTFGGEYYDIVAIFKYPDGSIQESGTMFEKQYVEKNMMLYGKPVVRIESWTNEMEINRGIKILTADKSLVFPPEVGFDYVPPPSPPSPPVTPPVTPAQSPLPPPPPPLTPNPTQSLPPPPPNPTQSAFLNQIRKGSQLRKVVPKVEPVATTPIRFDLAKRLGKIRKAVQGDTTSEFDQSTTV